MKESGQNPTDAEVQQIIKEVDLDGDGTINFDGSSPSASSPIEIWTNKALEFIAMMTGGRSRHSAPEPTPAAVAPAPTSTPAPNNEGDTEADYEAAWKEFDPSLKGSITAAQFRQLMAGLGENVTDAEVDELIGTVDAEDKISCKLCFYLECEKGSKASWLRDFSVREFVQFAKSKEVDDIVDGYAWAQSCKEKERK
jgi:hypothetical protein